MPQYEKAWAVHNTKILEHIEKKPVRVTTSYQHEQRIKNAKKRRLAQVKSRLTENSRLSLNDKDMMRLEPNQSMDKLFAVGGLY